MNVNELAESVERIKTEVSRALVGQDALVDLVLTAMLARGHVLIEGVPGLGKTLLVRTLASVIGAEFKRIQLTPDLMPSDITGGNVFNQPEGAFVFVEGPVFANLVLADEINRAPAKTQSALLEAMQDRSVTVDGHTRSLPEPFMVLATQNPVESQGTYPLPEAQLDRFLLKAQVDYPDREIEKTILQNHIDGFDAAGLHHLGLRRVVDVAALAAMQGALNLVRVEAEVVDYITDIVCRTRTHPMVYLGASPRGSIGLLGSSRAHAALEGRDFVTPDDVQAMAPAVLRHRIVLHPDAELEGVTPDHCIDSVLRDTRVPGTAA